MIIHTGADAILNALQEKLKSSPRTMQQLAVYSASLGEKEESIFFFPHKLI